jgi:hypothetical protein
MRASNHVAGTDERLSELMGVKTDEGHGTPERRELDEEKAGRIVREELRKHDLKEKSLGGRARKSGDCPENPSGNHYAAQMDRGTARPEKRGQQALKSERNTLRIWIKEGLTRMALEGTNGNIGYTIHAYTALLSSSQGLLCQRSA